MNGAKSHGPITPEGKARSSANSRRHGLAGAAILMDGESAEDFQLLRADFINQFHPQTAVEADLVDVMAIARWRLRRLLAIEAHLFDLEILESKDQIKRRSRMKVMEQEDRLAYVFQSLADNGNSLTLLLRYEGSLNRTYDKALKQLVLLQSKPSVGSFRTPENSQPAPSPTADTSTVITAQEDERPTPPTPKADWPPT